MEIYLDANATTPVLPAAQAAAQAVMADAFGNPSSIHGSGLRARAVLDRVRATARRVLGAPSGQVLFTSGATESIQTAVLSALTQWRRRRGAGEPVGRELLYGATEHKAVPRALAHWIEVLGLDLAMRAIPVGTDGRHDLAWLREWAPRAGLVCTMAANNETGVVSDLDGIANALSGSQALWLVDGVQALGKLPLNLAGRRIDYAAFSGHKLYAPKGIGLLYVREGAPVTPLLAGGGQEGSLRSGTENMAGIAALGAVLAAIEEGGTFHGPATLSMHRQRLADALRDAFPGLVFNAPPEACLPTTLNFAVPGVGARLLLDLFDAAGLRVSGGSACRAAQSQPSHVLQAMALPEWQAAAAVRLSFGAADDTPLIDAACSRIRACGASLRASGLSPVPPPQPAAAEPELITRFAVKGACCYLVADAASRRCIVIDPLPELTDPLARWVRCRGFALAAVLDTHSQGDHASSAAELRAAVPAQHRPQGAVDGLGWPLGAAHLALGKHRLSRLTLPGHPADSTAYLLHDGPTLRLAFVGDTVMPGALGRSDCAQSEPLADAASLTALARAVGPHTLLLPGHDDEHRFASTLAARADHGLADAKVEIDAAALAALMQRAPHAVVVDVREDYEQRLSAAAAPGEGGRLEAVPLSALPNALPRWMRLPADVPLVFCCRSGHRSAQAARALRRLGHAQAWSLEGGLALWQRPAGAAS